MADTHVTYEPTAEQLAEITLLAADVLRGFGIEPKGRAAVAFELRHQRSGLRAQDA